MSRLMDHLMSFFRLEIKHHDVLLLWWSNFQPAIFSSSASAQSTQSQIHVPLSQQTPHSFSPNLSCSAKSDEIFSLFCSLSVSWACLNAELRSRTDGSYCILLSSYFQFIELHIVMLPLSLFVNIVGSGRSSPWGLSVRKNVILKSHKYLFIN